MTPANDKVQAEIADQAGAWFIENRSGALGPAERAAFTAWLHTSPIHVREYLAVAVLSRDLPAATSPPQGSIETLLAEARADASNVVRLAPARRAPSPARASRINTWSFAAAAGLMLCLCSALWLTRDGERFGLPRTYSTAHGEQSVRLLPDGSVLHLNTDTELTVRYSRGERLVDLERGEALFQVAHDARRRFRVAAGEAGVLDVGTRFDAYRVPGGLKVTVVEGAVAVFTAVAPQAAQRVGAGYQVEIGEQVGVARRVDTQAAVAWLERRIAFENVSLGDVAAEFNRYGRISIEIEDPELRALPINGVFDAYDSDSFASFLETLGGVKVEKTSTRILVRKLAPADLAPAPRVQ